MNFVQLKVAVYLLDYIMRDAMFNQDLSWLHVVIVHKEAIR